MESNNINIDLAISDEEELEQNGNNILFVAKSIDNEENIENVTEKAYKTYKLISLIGVKDVIKDTAKDVVTKLHNNNVNVVMLTGDNEKTAKSIAKSIGITKVIANVLPKEKAKRLKN